MPQLVAALLLFILLGVGNPPPAPAVSSAETAATADRPAEGAAGETGEPPSVQPEASPPPEEATVEEAEEVEATVEEPAGEEESEAKPEGLGERLEEKLGDILEKPAATVDAAHGRISTGVITTARWFDSFFADPRVESEVGKTRLKMGFAIFREEGEPAEYEVRANLRLDLPRFEDKVHLLIAGDPEDDDDFRAATGAEGVAPELASRDETASVSLRYFLIRDLERNVSIRGGLRMRGGTPNIFLEPRYRQSVFFKDWLFRFTQRFLGFTNGTVGLRTTFDLERQLPSSDLFFRTTADGSWFSDENGYFYTLGASLFQPLSPQRALEYSWVNAFQTYPSHQLEEVRLGVRYRQQFWREWLFIEIIPQIAFPHDRDYKVTPGILLRAEMLFGDYPKLPPEKVATSKN